MTAPTVLDHLAPAPAARQAKPAPDAVQQATDAARVLVAGTQRMPLPGPVYWALAQTWRRAGRPLRVIAGSGYPVGTGDAAWWARRWADENRLHGITFERVAATDCIDTLIVFGPSAALRAALPSARRAGIDVVDGDGVVEWR